MEKKIKFWSPFNITQSEKADQSQLDRRFRGRQDLLWMLQASSDFGQDCEIESTDENLSMLAFFDSLVQRDLESDESDDTLSLDENDDDFNNEQENESIETVIAKKRKIALHRRSRRNPSQDSEELRLTLHNARDVLLSDAKPNLLVNAPESDDSMNEDILKELESEIHFNDTTTNTSSNDDDNESFKKIPNKGTGKKSAQAKSEYVRQILSRIKSSDSDSSEDDSKETELNEDTTEPQPSTSRDVGANDSERSTNKSSFKKGSKGKRNYRKPK